MCAAPRKPENKGLERNLSFHPTKGFRWKNPQTAKMHYLGLATTRGEANEAARALNLKFARNTSITDKVSANASTSVRKLIHLHRETFGRGLAESTTSGRRWELQKLERELGHLDAWDVTTRDLAQYLRTLKSDNVRVRYRARLCELFDTAVAEGYSENNPARALRAPVPEVLRSRLTYEAYQAIYAVAEPWLQNAMDFGLQTLQRRDDLVNLRWSALKEDALHVEQGKSGGQRRLAIKISPELRAVLTRCRDRIVCPFILHRLPDKARPQGMRAVKREHFAQVLPEQLTRAFGIAVERSGLVFATGKTRPTFHEIRSLGIALYRNMGWSQDQIQALAGHADESMTRHYMEGHEAPWQPVESGLTIGGKCY